MKGKKAKSKTSLTQNVMGQIHQKKIKMRPRLYFLLGSVLLGIGLAGIIFLTIFFTNLIFFRLQLHGPFGYLVLGPLGLRPFLRLFPWWPLLLALIGLGGGLILLKHYDLAYKKPFGIIMIVLAALILATGFLLHRLDFNQRAAQFKYFRPLYPPNHFAGQDWVRGEINQVAENELLVVTPSGQEVKIVISSTARLPLDRDFVVGETIRAVGQWQGENFVAQGIICNQAPPLPQIKGRQNRIKPPLR